MAVFISDKHAVGGQVETIRTEFPVDVGRDSDSAVNDSLVFQSGFQDFVQNGGRCLQRQITVFFNKAAFGNLGFGNKVDVKLFFRTILAFQPTVLLDPIMRFQQLERERRAQKGASRQSRG